MSLESVKSAVAEKLDHTRIDDFFKGMEAQGREWDAELALWGAKAHKLSESAKADFHTWQRAFREKQVAAQKKMETLRTAKNEAWEEVKSGGEAAWADVKEAFEAAKKKFN
jgi:hypothetical protein